MAQVLEATETLPKEKLLSKYLAIPCRTVPLGAGVPKRSKRRNNNKEESGNAYAILPNLDKPV